MVWPNVIPECYPYISAWGWGDPHIRTLDGLSYTFNGWGEYVLLEVTNRTTNEVVFTLQGRTDLAANENDAAINATLFSAFAAKDNKNSSFHVQLTIDKTGKEYIALFNFGLVLCMRLFYALLS